MIGELKVIGKNDPRAVQYWLKNIRPKDEDDEFTKNLLKNLDNSNFFRIFTTKLRLHEKILGEKQLEEKTTISFLESNQKSFSTE